MNPTTYQRFCELRDQRAVGEEAPLHTEKRAFEIAVLELVTGGTAQPTADRYPATLTEDLKEVLGMPNFRCAPIAHAFRDAGLADIPTKSEEEQAFVIDKLIRHVISSGPNWRKHAGVELGEVMDTLKAKKAGAA